MKPQWVLLLLLLLSILLSGQTLTENKARISSGFFLLRKCISDHSQEERVSGEEKTGLGKLGVEVHACPHYTQAGGLEFKTILSYYIESSRPA